MKRYLAARFVLVVFFLQAANAAEDVGVTITLESLLEEMVSVESDACFPVPFYSAKQLTSYDRRSIAPDKPHWHANDDWSGFIRIETNNGRTEKVLFDEQGPGVITRIITTGGDKNAKIRFYFDGEPEASIVIPTFDISKLPMRIPAGLICYHELYPTKKGCSLYYPIPYAKSCKITVDNAQRPDYVYHVNFRTYGPDVKVETFDLQKAGQLHDLAEATSRKLLQPEDASIEFLQEKVLGPKETLTLNLPEGNKAVRTLQFKVDGFDDADYARLMRGLLVNITFDETRTVSIPLGDFSGGGMGAPRVKNWYLSADGRGTVTVRFVMPYRRHARIELENLTECKANASVGVAVSDWTWQPNTLYFHASWRQERGLQSNAEIDYEMATLEGCGVFKADVLSLYNHMPLWYGEGDEHIWVDDDIFPSHFGCGTEDYYNTTYAPIHIFNTPFGGAPRADDEASQGYNTFVRTRLLDAIPFREKLKFEFELVSWESGYVDYSSTVFWYGNLDSKALHPSSTDEMLEVFRK
ncbi:MAG: DUF2961 domain-containing protein [Planctomycetaceae bacterium]|nr:DUF2961 domain-containing protein [Planctomycetaceae bacterium]